MAEADLNVQEWGTSIQSILNGLKQRKNYYTFFYSLNNLSNLSKNKY